MKRIALLGDLAFFGRNCIDSNKAILDYFSDASEYLKSCDFVVGNLETPFIEDSRPLPGKSASIKASPNNVELLKYLNVNAVTLANNHVYDFGLEGYELTKSTLDNNSIEYFGIEGKVLTIDEELVALSGLKPEILSF